MAAGAEAPANQPSGVPKPRNTTGTAAAPASDKLIDLLSNSSSAFPDLYARWGLKSSLGTGELGCKAAQAQGYDCLLLTGSWPKLRRYNLPAILEVLLPAGARKRVTLVGLDDQAATLAIAGHEYSFPLTEIDRVWDGSFILIWKPPFAPPYQLAPGASGESVVWVRKALDTLENRVPAAAVADMFDDELRQRILRFQRDRSLTQDGFVGNETLVRLTLALEGSKVPSLSKGSR
jgi:general secretion pathway protein A